MTMSVTTSAVTLSLLLVRGREAPEHHLPCRAQERRLHVVVSELLHFDARATRGRADAQIRGQLAAGNGHLVIVEVPRHRDEVWLGDHVVVAAYLCAPVHRRGEV